MGGTKVTQDSPMQLADHVRELRTRFSIVTVCFIAASCLAYFYREPLLALLLSPLDGRSLVYLNPAGGFNFIFLVSMYVGMAATAPLLVWQLYCFIRPILPKQVQNYSKRLLIGSMLLLIAGVAFGYAMAIPGALNFLYTFADEYVTASLTADSYLNFVVAYTLGLGLVFQLPLLLLIFHWIKPLTPGGLLKSERWIIVLAFVAAAIITPTPDPLNQTIIALPIIVVYQLGVALVLLSIRKQRKVARLQQAAARTAVVPVRPAVRPAGKLAVAAMTRHQKLMQQQFAQAKRPVRLVDGMQRPAQGSRVSTAIPRATNAPVPRPNSLPRRRMVDGFAPARPLIQ